MWGYPVAEPKDWATLTMLERLFTAIRFSRLNRDAELPPNFLPTAGEISEWLDDQYWDAEQQQSAGEAFKLLKRYHTLALIKLSDWAEVEDQLLLRCEAVVKVRLWLNQPGLDRERTFNYYSFRRGYSRLSTEEQRAFLRAAHHHLKSSFTKALHLKRRRLVGIKDGVSEYRVSVAHCYCPQEGYLEIELADNLHTQPFAYPGAKVEWNENLLKMPWAGCPVFAHVDGQSRELLQLKGLEAALARPSNKRDGEIDYTFNPEKRDTTGNPIAYPQDELLHDELTEYLTKRADDVEQRYVLIEEARVKREHRTPSANAEAEVHDGGSDDAADFNGVILQPRQTVIYLVPQKEEVVFVWASRFANSNKATYLFRAPAQEQHEALERLKTVLQGVGRIRSALLAPGRATHRLRRHLGYVTNIRGRRGHAEAFKLWQSRFDQALEDGPSTEHPYDPASDWQMSELETPTATSPKPINPTTVARASQMLERLRLLNLTFLSQYAA